MDNTQTLIEFRAPGQRSPLVKGDRRLLVVTHGSVVTRLEVKGDAIDGNGLFTLSDVTVPTVSYEQFKDIILGSAK
jgi:hypothetical protein